MAYVFSDEIEALLNAGPPAIDWNAISEELKKEYLEGRRVVSRPVRDGDEGNTRATGPARRSSSPPATVRVAVPDDNLEVTRCSKWSCLHSRDVMSSLVVDRPTVVVSGGVVSELVGLGAPWVTFSTSSVRELNLMGIDCAMTLDRTKGMRLVGAVIYRGSEDVEHLISMRAYTVLARLSGTVTYVTAHKNDGSVLARAVSHVFANGGRVCGYASRGDDCGVCGGTGLVVGELVGSGPEALVNALPYCICIAGHHREVRDDEQAELDNGAFIMGRYDGGGTPSDRWSDDEGEYVRGECDDGLGLARLNRDVAAHNVAGYAVDRDDSSLASEESSDDDLYDAIVARTTQPNSPNMAHFSPSVGMYAFGLCYLHMVRNGMLLQAQVALGKGPTVRELLLSPGDWFDLRRMRTLRVEVRPALTDQASSKRAWHVTRTARETHPSSSLATTLGALCDRGLLTYGEDSLAHIVSSWKDRSDRESTVELDDTVCGSVPDAELKNEDFADGWCYLRMVHATRRSEAAKLLKFGPTVLQVLEAPSKLFDLLKMFGLAFEVWDERKGAFPVTRSLHVMPAADARENRVFLVESLRWLCQSSGLLFGSDSLAHALHADYNVPASCTPIMLTDPVKGSPESAVSQLKDLCTVVPKGPKTLCGKCGFIVRADGHAERCKVGGHTLSEKFDVSAWVGDALHALDVRRCLAVQKLGPESRHEKYTLLVRGDSMAMYYRGLEAPPTPVVLNAGVSPSVHSVATLFERHYSGSFRDDYLRTVLFTTSADLDAVSGVKVTATEAGPVRVGAGKSGKYVRAVVMPPAHGKSYRHGLGKLVEADALCDPKSESLLVDLKARARLDPSMWPRYVAAWASRLADRCSDGDVVMVPDVDVADAAGFTVIGALLLSEAAWAGNLEGRTPDQVTRCRECYESVKGSGAQVYLCTSNEQLSMVLEMLVLTAV